MRSKLGMEGVLVCLHNYREIMCDASDVAIRAILGQRKKKRLHVIYYASRILNKAQLNYGKYRKRDACYFFFFCV